MEFVNVFLPGLQLQHQITPNRDDSILILILLVGQVWPVYQWVVLPSLILLNLSFMQNQHILDHLTSLNSHISFFSACDSKSDHGRWNQLGQTVFAIICFEMVSCVLLMISFFLPNAWICRWHHTVYQTGFFVFRWWFSTKLQEKIRRLITALKIEHRSLRPRAPTPHKDIPYSAKSVTQTMEPDH